MTRGACHAHSGLRCSGTHLLADGLRLRALCCVGSRHCRGNLRRGGRCYKRPCPRGRSCCRRRYSCCSRADTAASVTCSACCRAAGCGRSCGGAIASGCCRTSSASGCQLNRRPSRLRQCLIVHAAPDGAPPPLRLVHRPVIEVMQALAPADENLPVVRPLLDQRVALQVENRQVGHGRKEARKSVVAVRGVDVHPVVLQVDRHEGRHRRDGGDVIVGAQVVAAQQQGLQTDGLEQAGGRAVGTSAAAHTGGATAARTFSFGRCDRPPMRVIRFFDRFRVSNCICSIRRAYQSATGCRCIQRGGRRLEEERACSRKPPGPRSSRSRSRAGTAS